MFDVLVICYLFLGGAGAGALVVLSTLEIIGLTPRRSRIGATLTDFPHDFFSRNWSICVVVLFFGIICLSFDLGRFDRILHLLTSPTLSPVTIGAFSLVASLLCATYFMLVRLFEHQKIPSFITAIVGVLGIVAGLIAATYTGVLLASLSSVLFWQSPLLPVLFLLSSLSTGIACLLLGASFTESRRSLAKPFTYLARVDTILIAAELLCLTAYLVLAYLDSATTQTVIELVSGSLAWMFWAGIIGCGLVVPLVLEIYISDTNYRVQILWIMLLVLIGGLLLRVCIVETAAFDITQNPELIYRLSLT